MSGNALDRENIEDLSADGELSEGWATAAISDVTAPVPNYKPEAEPDREFGYIDIGCVSNESFRITTIKHFQGKDAPSRARRPIQSGDVLVSNVRTYLRNVVLVPERSGAGLCSTGFTLLRPNAAVVPGYLFRIALTDDFIDALTELQTGSNYPAVTDAIVMKQRIAVAPLAEQRRIVEAVDALLERVDAAKERLTKLPEVMKRFRQSVLAAACSGRLTADWREEHPDLEPASVLLDRIRAERKAALGKKCREPEPVNTDELPELPEGWEWANLVDICSPQRAFTYGVIKLGEHVANGIPTLRSSDVRSLHIEEDHVKCISPVISNNFRRTVLQGGEVLVTVRGTLGGVAVAPPKMKGFNVSREVAVVPIVPSVDAYYVSKAVASDASQEWLMSATKGGVYTGVNIEDLKLLPVPISPLAEQHEIVRRVEALFALADAIEKRVAAATARAEKLTQAILSKAFRGELVPTEADLARQEGRDYEPASVMLERVTKAKA